MAEARSQGPDRATDEAPGGRRRVGAATVYAKSAGRLIRVVAPATVITALLFYWGWLHAFWFFNYFGVNATILELTTSDYLLRSADGLFVLIVSGSALFLVALWIVVSLVSFYPKVVGWLRRPVVVLVSGVISLALVLYGLSWIIREDVAGVVPPLALLVGLPGLVWSFNATIELLTPFSLSTQTRTLESACVFLLISANLFWFVSDYSSAVASQRAAIWVSSIDSQPDVVVYSSQLFAVDSRDGVVRQTCSPVQEGTDLFVYLGYKILIATDSQLVLVPRDYPSRQLGVVVATRDTHLTVQTSEAMSDFVEQDCTLDTSVS